MQEANARTTLVVAHRLETVKKCDKIVVLDGGGVKEQGSHDELLEMEGIYHSLWAKQGHQAFRWNWGWGDIDATKGKQG